MTPAVENTTDVEVSSYLNYLPAIYRDDFFLGRFLRIFEDVLSPIQNTVNTLPYQFDAALASPAMLELLADWVGAQPANGLTDTAWRRLVKASLLLHRLRGTKAGLRMALEIATGVRPMITDFSPGLVLGQDASLGINTALEIGGPLQFFVTFDCRRSEVDEALVRDIISRYKPAHISYSVSFYRE